MIQASNLRTEYLLNPFAIDITSPRLMWNVAGAIKQSAYKIKAFINNTPAYESEKIETDEMAAVFATKLSSRDRVSWQVKLYDENGLEGEWSHPATFEMGLLNQSDWQAEWIMGNYIHSKNKKDRYPADCFLKSFAAPADIVQARLYITASGLYEAKINGHRVGNQYFTPGSTNYDVRTQYQTYDITDMLVKQNTLEIELGDGWYASKIGCFGGCKVFGHEPKLLLQLEMFDKSGNVTTICSNKTFLWSNDGPIRYADMKDGEIVEGGRTPSYSGTALETSYNGLLCCSNNVPVLEKERFTPKVLKTPDGQTVLDFGQNLAGYVEFHIDGRQGHKVTLVMGETLNEAGNFTIKNISLDGEYTKSHLQKIEYTCSGKARECYKPKFSFQGFQYALVQNWPCEINPRDFTAIAVYSDMEVTADFTCSHDGINKIVQNTLWSIKGNFLDVPTDCPTREKAGWTGDAQLFFNTGSIFMDQTAFFRKWLRDIRDEQAPSGLVYNINPRVGNFRSSLIMEGSSGWGDAAVLIPYRYWKRYGDDNLMKEQYNSMVKCVEYYIKGLHRFNVFSLFMLPWFGKHRKYIVASGRHFGEWTEPDGTESKLALVLPRPEEATAYLAYSLACLSEMAEHLGKLTDARKYEDLSKKMKTAYEYYFTKDKTITTRRMAKLVRPIALGMVDEEITKNVVKELVALTRSRNHKIGTGFLSTPFVLGVLTEAGYGDDAYKMLVQPELPGWMYQVEHGATTVWENWTPDASLNHYSKGACCEWLFTTVCGINTSDKRNHFTIKPVPCGDLTHASLEYKSVYGTVKSAWRKEKNKTEFTIIIPANCSAAIYLPNGDTYSVTTGTYSYIT